MRRVSKKSVLGRPGSDLLSRVLGRSIIGAEEFNGRVRNGIGYRLLANTTRPAKHSTTDDRSVTARACGAALPDRSSKLVVSPVVLRRTRIMRVIKPIELLVPVSSMRCRTYTPGLSTWWSTTALKEELVSRWVSRLDAFSDYPVRT